MRLSYTPGEFLAYFGNSPTMCHVKIFPTLCILRLCQTTFVQYTNTVSMVKGWCPPDYIKYWSQSRYPNPKIVEYPIMLNLGMHWCRRWAQGYRSNHQNNAIFIVGREPDSDILVLVLAVHIAIGVSITPRTASPTTPHSTPLPILKLHPLSDMTPWISNDKLVQKNLPAAREGYHTHYHP